jgi:hypothetical protein
VNNDHTEAARCGEYRPAWRNRGLQARYIIAESGAEAARFEKIPLHIDDGQRGGVEIDGKRRRFSLDYHPWHACDLPVARSKLCKIGASVMTAAMSPVSREYA